MLAVERRARCNSEQCRWQHTWTAEVNRMMNCRWLQIALVESRPAPIKDKLHKKGATVSRDGSGHENLQLAQTGNFERPPIWTSFYGPARLSSSFSFSSSPQLHYCTVVFLCLYFDSYRLRSLSTGPLVAPADSRAFSLVSGNPASTNRSFASHPRPPKLE